MKHYLQLIFTVGFVASVFENSLRAQDCLFNDTLFSINFGAGNYVQDFNLNSLKNYKRDFSVCPEDGFYSYVSNTAECFNGDWLTLPEDHTPGDTGGKMMIVNSAREAGSFFVATLDGFKPSLQYEFSVWLMNICRIKGGCPPLPPEIAITLQTASGQKIAEFKTGRLEQTDKPSWKRYTGFFSTGTNVTRVYLRMDNMQGGGCGNDFAMDDISVRPCYTPPLASTPPQPAPELKPVRPIVNESTLKTLKKNKAPVIPGDADDSLKIRVPEVNIKSPVLNTAPLLLTRENYLVKTIETTGAELSIQLYDNGQIDGDTVSIYHNNELIIAHAGLSEKPVSFTIKVDDAHPYHELIMVADNLGSIPPNTSLMIVNSGKVRYEIFISSSEQKNAKLIFRQKK